MAIIELHKTTHPRKRRPAQVVVETDEPGGSPFGSTFYKTLLRCPHEHALTYRLGFRPEMHSEPLDVGWLFHHGLEAYYNALKGRWDADALNRAEHEAFKALTPVSEEPGYEETYESVEKLLSHYFDHYRIYDNDLEVVAVEETLVWRGRYFDYSTRLDLLAIIDDQLYIIEHKTAKYITEILVTGYQLDLQILGQVWLLKRCVDLSAFPPFGGVIINIASKQITPQFVRVSVYPSNDHLEMFEKTMRQLARYAVWAKEHDYPRNLGSCSGFGRGYTRCPFFDLCHGRPDRTIEQLEEEGPPYGFVQEKR
jgi:hypothetical protein